MGGIAGLILPEADSSAARLLTAMTQCLHHRGPAAGGAVVFGPNGSPATERRLGGPHEPVDWGFVRFGVGLGARETSCGDNARARRQPISAPDRHTWIVMDGRIDNLTELRSAVDSRGMARLGDTPADIVLACYRAWDTGCFERLEGVWSLAIVDWAAGRVVLSRDRLGIKPLYLSRLNAGIGFASEIKSLLLSPGAWRGVNESALRDFLCDGRTDHDDQTLFERVWSAPAGCWLEFELRQRTAMRATGRVQRYWRPGLDWIDASDADREIRETLGESATDELAAAERVVKLPEDGRDAIQERMIWHLDMPFDDPAKSAMWRIAESAHRNGATSLSDSLSASDFLDAATDRGAHLAHWARRGRAIALVRETRAARRAGEAPAALIAAAVQRLAPFPIPMKRSWRARRFRWLDPDLFAVVPPPDLYAALRLDRPEPADGDWHDPMLTRHRLRSLSSGALPGRLRFLDRCTSAFALECRLPALDQRIVELAVARRPEPPNRRRPIPVGTTETAAPQTTPARPPATIDWMRGPLRPWWSDLIASRSFSDRGCFDRDGVQTLAASMERGDRRAAQRLWRVAIVEQWARQFLDTAYPMRSRLS